MNYNEYETSINKWNTTVKTPIRAINQGSQNNQININISITDAEIKIKSPLTNSEKKSRH